MKSFSLLLSKALAGCLLLFVVTPLSAQKATVKGAVADAVTSKPLASATIEVIGVASNKPVYGGAAGPSGAFAVQVPPGHYYAVVRFSGYRADTSAPFVLQAANAIHDLGVRMLQSTATLLTGVVVQAGRSFMKLELDKKIFSVGQDLANAGGSATDVLTNIPSVTVDPEGSVRLRGSDNVRILIDGKPSGIVGIKGSGGLQGLPANLIDRIEVITNPSARYEAEGNAGVINIVLKKDKRQGFNGSVDLISGNPANYGMAANLNYRHRKLNFFVNYGITYRHQPGEGRLYQEVYAGDTTLISQQTSSFLMKALNNNIRGGLDYYFSDNSILTGSYLFRRSDAKRRADIWYRDYLFDLSKPTGSTNRTQDETEAEPNSEYTVNYRRVFKEKDHELTATAKFIDNWESSNQLFTENGFHNNGVPDPARGRLQRSLNDEFEKQWLLQADYIQPLGKEGKLETGLRSSFRRMVNDFDVSERDAGGNFVSLPGLQDVFYYDEDIHAVYGIVAGKYQSFAYQAGLRAEWTDVRTVLEKTSQENPRSYANLFPSTHLSWKLPKEHAIQLSYSRRVRRPFYNDLSPFMTYSDARNFFSGNPDLDPEFSDVGEVTHIKEFERGSISSGVYYRYTKGKIERIRQVNDSGFAVTMPQNLKLEQAWGLEFAGTWKATPWWKLDASANFFYADVDGSNIISTYKASTYSWFARQTSRFNLPQGTELQLRANYEAAQRTVQGRRRGLYYIDLSAAKDLFKGNGTINLSVLDVFNSRWVRTITNGPNFYTDGESLGRRRQINLTLSYRIRQSKPAPKKEEE